MPLPVHRPTNSLPARGRTAAWLASACACLLAACGNAPLPAEPVARGDTAAVQRQLARFIDHEMKANAVMGLSIALVDDQQVIWAHGAGWADAAAQRPAGPDTLYRMGSVSKLLTDTAAMQLVAQQRLVLDAPIQQALPSFRIRSRWGEAPITARQLMTHHSGLPRDMLGGMWVDLSSAPVADFRTMLLGLAAEHSAAPPGLSFAYSNLGVTVLGAAVEQLAGVPFEAHLQRAVLAPLGMASASFSAGPADHPQMARAYHQRALQQEPALRDLPAGGLNASVIDLAKFIAMQFASGRNQRGEVVLPPAQWAEMLRVQNAEVALDVGFGVGLGWMFSTLGSDSVHGGGPVAHHAGATFYFRSQLMMLPEQRLGVIVAANDGAAGPVVNRVAQRALALMLEAKTGQTQPARLPGFVPAAQPWADAALRACVGDYTTPAGGVSVRLQQGRLRARVGDQTLDLVEGEHGALGLRYKLGGLIPVPLGPLGDLAIACRQIAGHDVLVATLDGQDMLVGDRLSPVTGPPGTDALAASFSAAIGRYAPELAPGERPTFDAVTLGITDGRFWIQPQLTAAFGGDASLRFPVLPLSDDQALLPGPLADSGPIVTRVSSPDGLLRFRFAGATFRRLAP